MGIVGICKAFLQGASLLPYLIKLLLSIFSFPLEEVDASTACIFCGKNSTETLLLITVVEIGLMTLFFSVWSLLGNTYQIELLPVFLT